MTSLRWAGFWVGVIALLLVVELAEVTRLFTLPVQSAFGNLLSFVFALVFTTVVALVGALFIGIYISQRLSSNSGFSPFEEEMLKMRSDVTHLREEIQHLRDESSGRPPVAPPGAP